MYCYSLSYMFKLDMTRIWSGYMVYSFAYEYVRML